MGKKFCNEEDLDPDYYVTLGDHCEKARHDTPLEIPNKEKVEAVNRQKEAETIKKQADEAFHKGDYNMAKELYEKAQELGETCQMELIDVSNKIAAASLELTEIVKINKDIKIATFAGQLRKYKKTQRNISESECETLGKLLKSVMPDMKNSEKRKWMENKNWKPIEDEIQNLAKIIFQVMTA